MQPEVNNTDLPKRGLRADSMRVRMCTTKSLYSTVRETIRQHHATFGIRVAHTDTYAGMRGDDLIRNISVGSAAARSRVSWVDKKRQKDVVVFSGTCCERSPAQHRHQDLVQRHRCVHSITLKRDHNHHWQERYARV